MSRKFVFTLVFVAGVIVGGSAVYPAVWLGNEFYEWCEEKVSFSCPCLMCGISNSP
jgi:hypothetical protein